MKKSSAVSYTRFKFDFDRCKVQDNQTTTELEPKVMAVLAFLYQHQGDVVSQQEIFAAVWQGRIYNQSLVQRAITLIRKALGEDAATACFLVTYPKKGYSLTIQKSQRPKQTFALFIIAALALLLGMTLWYGQAPKAIVYSSLSPIIKQHINEYSFSQNQQNNSAIFIKKTHGKYEIWQKIRNTENKLFTSETIITHVFWYQGKTAFTRVGKDHSTEFFYLSEQGKKVRFHVEPFELTSKPFAYQNELYYTSSNTLFVYEDATQQSKIVRVFSDVKNIKGIALSSKLEAIALLANEGQNKHKVITFPLSNSQVSKIELGVGAYNALDWHPSMPVLVIAKDKQLELIDLSGNKTIIPFATNKVIRAVQFSLSEDALILEQQNLTISLALKAKLNDDNVQKQINYSGVNLFPKSNLINNQLLFMSDHSGRQSLYLKDIQSEVIIASATPANHLSGFTWSADKKQLSYAINNILYIHDQKNEIKKWSLSQPIYIRDWFYTKHAILVNVIDNAKPYPSKFSILEGTLTKLTQHPASCAILDKNDSLYYVQGQQLLMQTSSGKQQVIHTLEGAQYDDLFTSKHYLYASLSTSDGFAYQQFDLSDFSMSLHLIPEQQMLAGVTHDDKIWLYQNIKYTTELVKLH